jgi:hypothetical protein
MRITTVLSASSNNHVCVCLERARGGIEWWEGRIGGLSVRLFFDDDAQEPDMAPMYWLHVYFGHPVTTCINAGSPGEDVDEDSIRYFILRDLANDGAPTGIVAGCPARAERLESGWLLSLWAEGAAALQAYVLTDCRGAV